MKRVTLLTCVLVVLSSALLVLHRRAIAQQVLPPIAAPPPASAPRAVQYEARATPSPSVAPPATVVTPGRSGSGNVPPFTYPRTEPCDAPACDPWSHRLGTAATGPREASRYVALPRQLSKADHLTAAAEHLAAAGLVERAAKLREEAASEARQVLLAKKLTELAALQAEIDQLRAQAAMPRQILAHILAIEVDLTRLRDSGVGFGEGGAFEILEAEQADAFCSALKKNKAVKVLAEPNIVTAIGRPATFVSGAKIPSPVKNQDGQWEEHFETDGTTVNLHPVLLESGMIRSDVRIKVAHLVGTTQVEGHTLPQLSVRQVKTAVELKPGQAVVVSGLRQVSKCDSSLCPCSEEDKPCDDRDENEAHDSAAECQAPHETEFLLVLRFEVVEALDRDADRREPDVLETGS